MSAKATHVYVMRFACGTVKVGITNDPDRRRGHIARVEGFGQPVEFHVFEAADPRRVERGVLCSLPFSTIWRKGKRRREYFQGVTVDQVLARVRWNLEDRGVYRGFPPYWHEIMPTATGSRP